MTRALPMLEELAEREMERWSRAAGVPPSMLGALGGIAGMSNLERAVHAVAMEAERFRFSVRLLGGDADTWTAWVSRARVTTEDARGLALSSLAAGYSDPAWLDIVADWRFARRKIGERSPVPGQRAAAFALGALAYEIDDRRATLTGETACATCGGRGEQVAWGRERAQTGLDVTGCYGPRRDYRPPPECIRVDVTVSDPAATGDWQRWHWAFECPCDGRRRPATVSLRRALSRPSDPWPTLWMVNTDAMEANGWGDTVLPGGEFVPAWMCRWWRAFRQLALAGETPDAAPLFADLEALLPGLEARARGRGSQHGAAG